MTDTPMHFKSFVTIVSSSDWETIIQEVFVFFEDVNISCFTPNNSDDHLKVTVYNDYIFMKFCPNDRDAAIALAQMTEVNVVFDSIHLETARVKVKTPVLFKKCNDIVVSLKDTVYERNKRMQYIPSKNWQWVTRNGQVVCQKFETLVTAKVIKNTNDAICCFHKKRHFPREFKVKIHFVKIMFKEKSDAINCLLNGKLYLKNGIFFEDYKLRIGYVQLKNPCCLANIKCKLLKIITGEEFNTIVGNKKRASKHWVFYKNHKPISISFAHFEKPVTPYYLEMNNEALSRHLCFREFDVNKTNKHDTIN
uniref:Uncharacterized protein n=1 Tax=Pasiphaea japonica whispovirus TaxID=2984286 RepID=A0A9C7BRL4_9VIRU|nr:MAG: hypothetical protein [Pasiphaea japonica whispovirus]